MSDLRTSLPIPTQPWEAARSRFLVGLSEEEAKRFKDATLENLFYDASATQKSHAHKSRSWLMQERLSSLIDSAAEYGKALDVYSNTYGLIICPIWGSLRVVLHIAREAGRFQEKIVEMFAQIGDVLPRFRIYQALFRDHERLLVALSAAYLDVLRFCVRAKDFFKRAKQSMIPLSVVLKGAWRSFRASFEESMSDFRKHSKNIEKEANLAHMIESARRHEIELANRALQIRNQKLAKRHRLLSIIPSVDYQSKLSRLSNQRHPNTTQWINQNLQFSSWSASTHSDCFCLYGIPGSGKSVLAASVVDALKRYTLEDAESLVCYYIFDYTDLASLESLRLVGSLIQQVLQALPLDIFDEDFQCPFAEDQPWPAQPACVDFLFALLEKFKTIWLVLDAIDEPALEAQTFVLHTINRLLGLPSTMAKVFVTSRVENYLIRNTLELHKSLKLTQKDIDKDISLYVDEQIRNTLLPCNPLLENERFRKEVIHELTENANGMFLWVRFQLYNLAEVLTEIELRKVLKDLPKDLHETYSRIIEKAGNGPGGQAKLAMMQKLFRWVAVARRPLKLQELEEAAGLKKTDTCLHTDRTAVNSGQRLINHCGNLLVYNEEEDTVTFAHHTILQFLYSDPESLSNQASSTSINCATKFLSGLELASAHKEIGELCLAYLDFTDFQTQIVQSPKGFNLKKDEAERLVWMSVFLAAPIKWLISWTQTQSSSSETRPNCGVTYTMPAVTRPSESLVQKYSMLDYISTFWVFHTSHLTAESAAWAKFKHIALHKNLSFEHRPWNDQDHRARVEKVVGDMAKEYSQLQQVSRWRSVLPEMDWIGTDMLLYALAMEHGIGSLLRIVDTGYLRPYFEFSQISRSSMNLGIRFESHLEKLQQFIDIVLLDRSGERGSRGFWNTELVLHFYQSESFDSGSTPDVDRILNFLKLEHSRWVDESEVSMKQMLHQAITLAAQRDHVQTLDRLLDYHISTFAEFVTMFVNIVRNGPPGPDALERLLQWNKTGWSHTKEKKWQLIFAIHECLPSLESLFLHRPKLEELGSSTIIKYVLVVLLATSRRPSLLYQLFNLRDKIDYVVNWGVERMVLPTIDWTTYTFGSEKVYEGVLATCKRGVMERARSISRLTSLYKDLLLQKGGPDISLYYDSKAFQPDIQYFNAKSFETDGYHLLALALSKQAWSIVDLLVAPYWDFVRDTQQKKGVLRILQKVDLNEIQSMFAAFPLLPMLPLHKALKQIGDISRRGGREPPIPSWLLDRTIQPANAEAWMEFRKTFSSVEAWKPVLQDGFKEWRRIVEEEW